MTRLPVPLVRAIDLYRSGDLEGARRAAQAAMGGGPADPAVLQFLGHVCCRLGDFEAGTAHLRRGLDLEPGNAAVRVELARALLASGDLEGAVASAEASDSLPPAAGAE